MDNSSVVQRKLKEQEYDNIYSEIPRGQRRKYATKDNAEHRDEIIAEKKAHYEVHEDRHQEYNHKYNAEYRKRRWMCPVCNVSRRLADKSPHGKSQVHADFQKPIPVRELIMGCGSPAFKA